MGKNLAWAQEASIEKNILILIGYADENYENDQLLMFSHIYHQQLAVETEAALDRFLIGFQFQKNDLVYRFTNTQITILNANTRCPDETIEMTSITRRFLCASQIRRSQEIKSYLEAHLNQFDHFFYIGHARKGHGLGVGPFVDNYTFPLKFYNSIELGKLKSIILASCDSAEYYDSSIYKKNGVEFKGVSGKKLWMQDQLPFLLNELRTLLLPDFLKQNLRL